MMKGAKVFLLAAVLCLRLLFCPSVAGSSPVWHPEVQKEDDSQNYIQCLVEETFQFFDQGARRSDHLFSTDARSTKLRKEGKIFADYLDLFKHSEVASMNAPFFWEIDEYQKGEQKYKSPVNFEGFDTYDLSETTEDALHSFLLLLGSLVLFAAMIFGYIPIKSALGMILLWIIFWKPVVSFILLVLPDKVITLLKTVLQRI